MPDKYVIMGITGVVTAIILAFLINPLTSSRGATTDSDTRLIPLNIPAFGGSQCTYFVFQGLPKATNNYTTYAIDCSNNQLVSSSYNASLVFNTLTTKCNANNGCLIHVKGYSNSNLFRAYNITKAIQLPESGHFNLEGDGNEFTVFKIPSTYDNNMFEYAGNHTNHIAFFNSFSEFQMVGNSGTGGVNNRGFYLNTTSGEYIDSLWFNLFLRDFKTDDIYIGSLVSGINNCWNNKFDDNTIELAGRGGMYIVGGINCQDLKVTNNKFLFNHVYGTFTDGYMGTFTSGFYYKEDEYGFVNNGGIGNIVSNNKFYDNSQQTNNVYYDLWNLGNNNVINDNMFEGADTTNKPKYGLYQDTFTHRNVITGNDFSTVTRTYATATYFMADKQQDTNLLTNNVGVNSIGKVTTPFYTGTTGLGTTIIPTSGNVTAPRNNTDATNVNTPIYMTISGGTGVSITLKDNLGNTIQSGLATITEQEIPFMYKINVRWATVPTFTVYFQ